MKRVLAFVLAAALSSTAFAAADPRTLPTKLSPEWQAKTRDVFKQAIEIPTVHNRGEMPRDGEAAGRPVPRRRHSRTPTFTSCLMRRCPATRRSR